TGEQGVMIPRSNLRNLMLKDEVVEAIRAGKFHIWSVETIDQGIEILTGVSGGEKGPDGGYPEGTINQKVDMRLREILENMRKFSAGNEKDEKK
ncbi:MAG: ATP-dependent protease, partial [Geobacteraceae bacterium]|nr:ATP-dependent protease [Geobacteraceae bacterium]